MGKKIICQMCGAVAEFTGVVSIPYWYLRTIEPEKYKDGYDEFGGELHFRYDCPGCGLLICEKYQKDLVNSKV